MSQPKRPSTAFTKIVLRCCLKDPDMPETVRQWWEEEPEPEMRQLYFACNLSEDLMENFHRRETPQAPENKLHNQMLREALDRVDWQRVAAYLLQRFDPKIRCVRFRWRPSLN